MFAALALQLSTETTHWGLTVSRGPSSPLRAAQVCALHGVSHGGCVQRRRSELRLAAVLGVWVPWPPEPASPPLKSVSPALSGQIPQSQSNERVPPRAGGGRGGQGECRRLEGSDTALQDAVLVDAGRQTCVQTHRTHSTKSDPNVSCGPISIAASIVMNGPRWWGTLIMGEVMPVVGRG